MAVKCGTCGKEVKEQDAWFGSWKEHGIRQYNTKDADGKPLIQPNDPVFCDNCKRRRRYSFTKR